MKKKEKRYANFKAELEAKSNENYEIGAKPNEIGVTRGHKRKAVNISWLQMGVLTAQESDALDDEVQDEQSRMLADTL